METDTVIVTATQDSNRDQQQRQSQDKTLIEYYRLEK
jgi:hypothetical protein